MEIDFTQSNLYSRIYVREEEMIKKQYLCA